MKSFALPLCLLFAGTCTASNLLRRSDEIHEDLVLSTLEERTLSEHRDAETQVRSVDLDELADAYINDPKSDGYDTAQVYKACRELQQPPQQRQPNSGHPLRPDQSLRQFCEKIGPDLGSLCFEDSNCGGFKCSTLTEGPMEAIKVTRLVPSFWSIFPGVLFWQRQSTTYKNVFICHDETDRSDSVLNIGRKPLCQQGCKVCRTAAYRCKAHTDCVLGSLCIESSDLGISFCGTRDELVAQGGCCTDGAKCANKFCDMSPGVGSVMDPEFPPGVIGYPTSIGVCGNGN